MPKKCKKCGAELSSSYSEIMKSELYVVVDEQIQQAIILNKGDCLCETCSKVVTYYQHIG